MDPRIVAPQELSIALLPAEPGNLLTAPTLTQSRPSLPNVLNVGLLGIEVVEVGQVLEQALLLSGLELAALDRAAQTRIRHTVKYSAFQKFVYSVGRVVEASDQNCSTQLSKRSVREISVGSSVP